MSIFRTKYKNVTVNFLPDTRIQNLFPLTFKVIDGFNLPGYRMDIQSKYNHRCFKCSATECSSSISMILKILTIILAFQSYSLLRVIIVDNLHCKVTYSMVLSSLIFVISFICCNVIREFI